LFQLPLTTKALLLDLDGVIVDTSSFEKRIVEDFIGEEILESLWEQCFPLPLHSFLHQLSEEGSLGLSWENINEITSLLQARREEEAMPLVPGILNLISLAKESDLVVAVVSNNPAEHTEKILENIGLSYLPVFGIDDVDPKPKGDIYLHAASELGFLPSECLALEDSEIGVAAARDAGIKVYALSGFNIGADSHYRSLKESKIFLRPGLSEKSVIDTGSNFLSHMVEHILWRIGFSADIYWNSDNYYQLGKDLMSALLPEGEKKKGLMATTLDGSLSRVEIGGEGFFLDAPDWFAALPVEDLPSGESLLDLLFAISEVIGIRAEILAIDDPHHAWESLFRSLGAAIADTYFIREGEGNFPAASFTRETAESLTRVELGVGEKVTVSVFDRGEERKSGWSDMLASLVPFSPTVRFENKGFFSSHVVAEDIGIALGSAFRLAAEQMIKEEGIRGFAFKEEGGILLSLSFEGRSGFFQTVKGDDPEAIMEKDFSQKLDNGLLLEDLDDFFLGFSWGMGVTIAIARSGDDPKEEWQQIYENFAGALRELFLPFPERKGVIVGTKANLF
jgi:HAD superfamily hydrolase (TIGR01509 family)